MQLPIGYDDFRSIIDDKLGFIDKSLFIKEVLETKGVIVSVITRPRRFGKTLNLSMLRYFFAAEVDGRLTKGLFDSFKIAHVPGNYLEHQGQYPVIFVTFKDIKDLTFQDAVKDFCLLIRKLYRSHGYLQESTKLTAGERKLFTQFFDGEVDKNDLEQSLSILSEFLYKHYGKKVYILIDEYDTPIQAGYVNGYYDEMISFSRNLLSAALKTNSYLQKSIITGVIRIAKESLFSGLNNVEVYSVLQDKYSEFFGFTENEVKELLIKTNMLDKADEIRNWYNGYRFGNTVIYNPWSIANCVNKNSLQPYWVNTSDSALIYQLLINSSLELKEQLESLLTANKVVEHFINEHVVFGDLKNNEGAIWSLLVTSGYLKVSSQQITDQGTLCQLEIPNHEIRTVYRAMLESWLAGEHDLQWYNGFLADLLEGRIDGFTKKLKDVMLQIVSIHDTAKEPESFYHGLLLGFTASLSSKQYEIKSNRESGLGRFDILLIPRDNQKLGIILELKAVKLPKKLPSEETQEFIDNFLGGEAKLALEQIKAKKYSQELSSRGIERTLAIGIAFAGKEFRVET